MRTLFLALIVFATGCAIKDKKTDTESSAVVVKSEGEILFKNNCAPCHKIDKDFTGPALKGALSRWGDKKAMYDFIKNPSKSIDENAYAKQLDKKWENVIMTSFPYLSDPGIDSIMNFIENYIAPITTIKVAVD